MEIIVTAYLLTKLFDIQIKGTPGSPRAPRPMIHLFDLSAECFCGTGTDAENQNRIGSVLYGRSESTREMLIKAIDCQSKQAKALIDSIDDDENIRLLCKICVPDKYANDLSVYDSFHLLLEYSLSHDSKKQIEVYKWFQQADQDEYDKYVATLLGLPHIDDDIINDIINNLVDFENDRSSHFTTYGIDESGKLVEWNANDHSDDVSLKVGDILRMGIWEEKTIEWQIISNDYRNGMYALCTSIIHHSEFSVKESNNWNDSKIRKWLNRVFFETAFSNEEKACIRSVDGDKITILSKREAERYFHGKKCIAQKSSWWLRSPNNYYQAGVWYADYRNSIWGIEATETLGVRPAFHISSENIQFLDF